MLRELTEWLALVTASLEQQHGIDFLRQLRRMHRLVSGNPQLGPLLAVLRSEAYEIDGDFHSRHKSIVDAIVRLKAEAVKLHAPLQNLHSTPYGPNEFNDDHNHSFAVFDRIATMTVPPPMLDDTKISSMLAHRLSTIVARRLGEAQQQIISPETPSESEQASKAPTLEDLRTNLHGLEQEFRHCFDVLEYERATHPGFALRYIDEDVDSMLSPPGSGLYFDALRTGTGPQIAERAGRLKSLLFRVYQELQLRLVGQRSLLALLERFRGRCELHDRESLRELADSAPGKPEHRLVDVMSRWLYDQGLNPLRDASLGRIRPDLLDPSIRPAVYVEAKQCSRLSESEIKDWIAQVDDTAARLAAEPYRIQEAFLAVFCRGGPMVSPPTFTLRRGAYVLYMIVIDLRPIEEIASRASEPSIVLTEDVLNYVRLRRRSGKSDGTEGA